MDVCRCAARTSPRGRGGPGWWIPTRSLATARRASREFLRCGGSTPGSTYGPTRDPGGRTPKGWAGLSHPRTQVWGPSKYEFEGPHGRTKCVTSPLSQTVRQTPPTSSPADAVSRLTVRILGFRPIPPSLAGGRERCLHAPNQPAQPLTHNKNQKTSAPGVSSTELPNSSTETPNFSTETPPPLWRTGATARPATLRR